MPDYLMKNCFPKHPTPAESRQKKIDLIAQTIRGNEGFSPQEMAKRIYIELFEKDD